MLKKTNSHFIPELVICALGDLTMQNLAYTTQSLDRQHPTFVVSMKIPFICLFWSWVESLLVLGCRSLSAPNGFLTQRSLYPTLPTYH
jgi:hypothetical protein